MYRIVTDNMYKLKADECTTYVERGKVKVNYVQR